MPAMRRTSIAVLLAAALLQTLAACGPQAPKTAPHASEAPVATPPPPAAPEERPVTEAPPPSTPAAPPPNLEGYADEPALKDVLFEPDRADIVREGTSIMLGNARWLLARWLVADRHYLVLIEGHARDKGSREDNLGLAELRARAAERFLVTMGVPATSLLTVSYGSDRPVCVDKSQACAARNRRVHFRVKVQ